MIKIENVEVSGWEAAIRGMRNPMNSWEKSDSEEGSEMEGSGFKVGPNDFKLMLNLAKGGPVHAKYRRMINVTVDITAPLYWWKEFDTNKVGTVANSCSTMHKIAAKEFELSDFSHEHLIGFDTIYNDGEIPLVKCMCGCDGCHYTPFGALSLLIIPMLNLCREKYLNALKTEEECGIPAKEIWWQMIQLLPTSYNQRRTVQLNYEVLHAMYFSRKHHKLDEWVEYCKWIETLPHSEIITTEEKRFDGQSDWIKMSLMNIVNHIGDGDNIVAKGKEKWGVFKSEVNAEGVYTFYDLSDDETEPFDIIDFGGSYEDFKVLKE